jgi:ketopantoate reductase
LNINHAYRILKKETEDFRGMTRLEIELLNKKILEIGKNHGST